MGRRACYHMGTDSCRRVVAAAVNTIEDSMTETELQDAIIDVAERAGWLIFHDYDSRRNRAGFPDLVLVKPPRVLFVELKKKGGVVSPNQRMWLDALARCDTIAAGVVYPKDQDAMFDRLLRKDP